MSEFRVEPPSKGAPPEAWVEWLQAEKRAAAAAKRKRTMARAHGEIETPTVTRKVGGVWSQGSAVGLSGDSEQGTLSVEPISDATQDSVILKPWAKIGGRGVSKRKSGGARRKAKKRAQRNPTA